MRRFDARSVHYRRRHPADRGTQARREVAAFFRRVLKRIWTRHPAPFAKTRRGYERRMERRFVMRNQHSPTPDFLAYQEAKLDIMDDMRRDGWL